MLTYDNRKRRGQLPAERNNPFKEDEEEEEEQAEDKKILPAF
jgi:hypothetical protein